MEFLLFFLSVFLFTAFLLLTYCEDTFSHIIFSKIRFLIDRQVRIFINSAYACLFKNSSFVRLHYSNIYNVHKTKKESVDNYVKYLKTGHPGQQKTLGNKGKPSDHLVYIKKEDF